MIINNAKYIETFGWHNNEKIDVKKTGVVATIDGEVMSVPMDTANRHYAEILKQVANGTITIAEAD
jgi:hypothetical protein